MAELGALGDLKPILEMSLSETIVLLAVLLLPPAGYLLHRRMRAMQRNEIEARHDRLYRDVLESMAPEEREEFLRLHPDAASSDKPG